MCQTICFCPKLTGYNKQGKEFRAAMGLRLIGENINWPRNHPIDKVVQSPLQWPIRLPSDSSELGEFNAALKQLY